MPLLAGSTAGFQGQRSVSADARNESWDVLYTKPERGPFPELWPWHVLQRAPPNQGHSRRSHKWLTYQRFQNGCQRQVMPRCIEQQASMWKAGEIHDIGLVDIELPRGGWWREIQSTFSQQRASLAVPPCLLSKRCSAPKIRHSKAAVRSSPHHCGLLQSHETACTPFITRTGVSPSAIHLASHLIRIRGCFAFCLHELYS